jgi:hypothetical protein
MGSVTCLRGCPYYVKENGVWVCGVCRTLR